ncbi:MAG TPA: PEGA domain-containing protein [Vicinamibacterales bacterium]|nr:PEGA domain-containing protein [Vicinamibacterales bacterium]
MNRGVLFAVIAVVLLGGTAYYLHGPRSVESEAPAPVATAPRIVPKKNEPVPTPARPVAETATRPAKKEAPTPPPVPKAPAAPTLASLTLDTDVPGASVFIDRAFVGNTPLSLDKLAPGTKRVQITATGFDSVQKTIELNPGPNAITIRVKEVSLNARTTVVHKHAMGSCEGQLSATLDGLRYDTSNKGDAFAIPYAQVETFVVDYLQKNLRVKQKGGKTWNFTDKNDNADVLFVFHRDVEAARKKLADGYARAQ